MKKSLHNPKGFTLLEILVGITLMAVALFGMVAFTAALVQGNDFSNRLTTVTEGYNAIPNYSAYKRVTSTDVDRPAAGMETTTATVSRAEDTHSVAPQTIPTQ